MASIRQQIDLHVRSDQAWAALRQVANAHRLFAPVLVDAKVHGDMRTVTFANGLVARERIVDVNDDMRRVAYSATDVPGMTYHHASMQVLDAGPGRTEFIWITDFLPAEMAEKIAPLIEQGTRALKSNLESR
jgi:hypothetical protein